MSDIRVGLIADTHGLLRREARSFLLGSDLIVHAGDIGKRVILEELHSIAPVIAVRGNNDTEPWAAHLPETHLIEAGGVRAYVIHNRAELDLDPPPVGVQVVVSGHSHRPMLERRDGVLFVNPGSAGPRRFKLPIAIGELLIAGGAVGARIVNLEDTRLLVASTL